MPAPKNEFVHPDYRQSPDYQAAVAEEALRHDDVIDVTELESPPARDLQAELKELVVDIADLEPVSGWSHARDLPPLEPDAVQLVLATRAVDVTDNCALDVTLLAPLLLQSGHAADTAIAAHLRSAIELAARESLWPDIKSRLHDLAERRYERDDELRAVNFAFDRVFR